MYLKRLELTGFKSFAQRTILEFPKPQKENFNITAIIGANGGGKSNCAESIRWTLGEQSAKALRGKKLEDVIFSGSKEKTRLNSAEVILFFNNEDATNSVGYKEFTITRRIYRNGESEYLINKSRVKLQDILVLLAKANFGQKSYSIIGQGMVDQILIASPLERKKFFDEATGIKQYQIKKDSAIRKIEKSQLNLNQAETALNEITPRLRSLTRQINKLTQREKIQTELHNLQKRYYGSLWQDLNQKVSILRKKLDSETKEQKNIEKELNVYAKESKNLVYEQIDKQYQEIEQEYQKIIKIKNERLSKQSVLRAQLIFEQEKIKHQTENTIETSIDSDKIFSGLKKIQTLQKNFIEQIDKISEINKLYDIKLLAKNIFEKINQLLNFFQPVPHRQEFDMETNQKTKSKDKKQMVEELENQQKSLEQEIKKLDQELSRINNEISQFTQREKEKIFKWQNKIQEKQSQLNQINSSTNETKINLVRLETKKEDLEQEIKKQMGDRAIGELMNQTAEKLGSQMEEEINKLKHQLELIGGIDPEIEKEYPTVKERYEFLNAQTSDLKKSLKSLDKIVEELNQKIKNQFKENFSQINQKFDRYFKTIFKGGNAKIIFHESPPLINTLIEDSDRTEKETESETAELKTAISEIDILATPPGKKIKSIEMLSGGERALTALALICAIISINEPPFVILDEVDTALDQENSLRFTEILKELKRHTQFIVITHNQQTIEIADVLYGVSMGRDGISRLISLKLESDGRTQK